MVWPPLSRPGDSVFPLKGLAVETGFEPFYLNKLQNLYNKVIWTDETKAEMFDCNTDHIWQKTKLNPTSWHKHYKSFQTW